VSVNVLMEIDPDKREVWFRLYPMDSIHLREQLAPGTRVNIRGVISAYEASGGYAAALVALISPSTAEDAEHVEHKDRFKLSAGALELWIEPVEGV